MLLGGWGQLPKHGKVEAVSVLSMVALLEATSSEQMLTSLPVQKPAPHEFALFFCLLSP